MRQSAVSPQPRPSLVDSLRGIRVLVVDDDENVREALAATLSFCGADVTTAGSAAAARRSIAEAPPDAILCDLMMPGEDGCRFMQGIRGSAGLASTIPACVVTASRSEPELARALGSGFSLVLHKPFGLDDIAAAVLTLLPDAGRDC